MPLRNWVYLAEQRYPIQEFLSEWYATNGTPPLILEEEYIEEDEDEQPNDDTD